jgi:hypothetical protein
MTEVSLLKLCDAQTRLLLEALGPRDLTIESRDEVRRVESLLDASTHVCEAVADALESLKTALFLKKIRKTQAIALAAGEALPRLIAAMERVRRLARTSEIPEPRAAEFERVVDQFRHNTIDFLMQWPRADLGQIAESAAAYERGEFQSARDALNELLHRSSRADQAKDRAVELIEPPH